MTLSLIERLYRRGIVSEEAVYRGRAYVRSASFSWKWFDRLLLGLGVGLLLIGTVFLVAYNWQEVPKLGKLGLVEAVLVACFATAGWRGLDSRVGNAALIAGSVVVGVFLAVFGQIYQTGADPWELFAGWAALIVGFAWLARSQVLWMLWLFLVYLAGILYWEQVLAYGDPAPSELWLTAGLGAFGGAALSVREYVWRRWRPGWLEFRWSRWLLAGGTLAALTYGNGLAGVYELFFWGGEVRSRVPLGLVNVGGWCLAAMLMYRHFRRRHFDMGVLALVGVSAGAFAMSWGYVGIFEWLAIEDDTLASFLFSLVGLVTSTGLAVWFRAVWHAGEASDERSGREVGDE